MVNPSASSGAVSKIIEPLTDSRNELSRLPAMKNHSQQTRRPSAIDLFSGAGGLSLGLEQAGFEIVGSVEYDPVHLATHEFNFPDSSHICASVSDLKGPEILEASGLDYDDIDLIAGGPPCQGFSMIGKRALQDERNRLVFDFCRIIGEIRPRYFIMENVPGMKVGEHAGLLYEVVQLLTVEHGYNCRPVELLTATNFGVPQVRTRLFVVGARDEQILPRAAAPTTRFRDPRRPDRWIGPDGLPPCPTVGDALRDLPNADDYEDLLESDSVRASFSRPTTYGRIIRGLDREPDDFSYHPVRPRYSVLTSSTRTVHTDASTSRFAATRPGEVESISRFLRLSSDGYSNTLRAGTDSKRGAHTSPRPIHPEHPRVITVREAARLHSFPDWFRLHATKWHGFRQVGNAVAPRVGRAVGATILEALQLSPQIPASPRRLGDPRLLQLNMSEAAVRYGVSKDVVGNRDRHQRGAA